MADQTTLSSVEDSILNSDVTTTTTPPTNDLSFSKSDDNGSQLKASVRASTPDLDDINGVLGGLNLDMAPHGTKASTASRKGSSSIFSAQFSPLNQHAQHTVPSTPPPPSNTNVLLTQQGGSSSASGATTATTTSDFASGFQPRTPSWVNGSSSGVTGLGSFSQSIMPDLANTPHQQQQYMQFDPSANNHNQFLSLTPNAGTSMSSFGGSQFASSTTNHSTPFSSTKVAVPSSAPPARRTTTLGFANNRPFMLPETNSSSTLSEKQPQDDNSIYDGTSAASTGSALLNSTPNNKVDSSSAASFGPPLMGETSRRLTYPVASPSQPSPSQGQQQQQQSSDSNVDSTAISALHPALTNEMLSVTVAGGSIGMGITNGSTAETNAPSGSGNHFANPPMGNFNNGFGAFQIPPPTAGMHMVPGMSNQIPLGSANAMNYPTINMNQPNPFGSNSGFMKSNSFSGFNNNNMGKQAQQQQPPAQQQQQPPMIPGQQTSPNGGQGRTNLGLNATANIHRKHSSNKRRGEDASKFINASLNDFVNEIYFLCKDQHGCRFLQRQLELGGSEAATKIFNEIQLNVIELMIDPFGNYLIQKLLERVNEEQRTTLVHNASSQFVRIALDPHGTRALQKLVECISTPTEFQIIISSLSSYVVLLSRDLNGNHVVQKCLQKLPPDSCDFIFDAACENSVKIAKHRHGCCVLQRCFDHGTPQQCERLSLKVGENCVELSVDPYGNYVVQYVLSMEENRLRIMNDPNSATTIPNTKRAIDYVIGSLTESLTKLSTHKFGSNVIEKSLRIPTLAPVLINQLLKETTNLKLLLHDAYGNYVLQTALDVADDASFKELSELLKPYLGDVRNTPHGRRILSKLISRGGASAGVFAGSSGMPQPTQQSGSQNQTQSQNNQQQNSSNGLPVNNLNNPVNSNINNNNRAMNMMNNFNY